MIDAQADWHIHTDRTDGADSLQAMVSAAEAAGLRTLGVSDHVRRSTTWLPEYVREVRGLRSRLELRCGVEAKILDSSGRLDLPDELPPLDYLLIADHRFPGDEGPQHPDDVRAGLADGAFAPRTVVDVLVDATCAALALSPVPPIVAHLFSLLPKCGLDETLVEEGHLEALARACLTSGGAVEVNEKWRCPGARVLEGLAARGVRLTAGSDAHRAADVGRWSYLLQIEGQRGGRRE